MQPLGPTHREQHYLVSQELSSRAARLRETSAWVRAGPPCPELSWLHPSPRQPRSLLRGGGACTALARRLQDYTGSSVYMQSQLRAAFEELASTMFGNPHAQNPSSELSTQRIDEVGGGRRRRRRRHRGACQPAASPRLPAPAPRAVRRLGARGGEGGRAFAGRVHGLRCSSGTSPRLAPHTHTHGSRAPALPRCPNRCKSQHTHTHARACVQVRTVILQHFNADPSEWQLVFTRSATGALKMVGETFPWTRGSLFRRVRSLLSLRPARRAAPHGAPCSRAASLGDHAAAVASLSCRCLLWAVQVPAGEPQQRAGREGVLLGTRGRLPGGPEPTHPPRLFAPHQTRGGPGAAPVLRLVVATWACVARRVPPSLTPRAVRAARAVRGRRWTRRWWRSG